MTLYTATINLPGYLPDSADPAPLFRTPEEAWRYLYEEHSAAWGIDGEDELHLETDTQFHVHPYGEPGELHAADGYVYSVSEAVDLPSNRVEIFDYGAMSGTILFFTDEDELTVRDTIASNVGIWWNLNRDYPDTDTDGVILLSDDWEARFNYRLIF